MRRSTRWALVSATASTLASAGIAHAADAEVQADTAVQFYEVRSPTGATVLARRRLTSTIGVAGYDLLRDPSPDKKAAELTFRGRVRYDADYGADGAESDPNDPLRFVPGFDRGPVDIMYAYLEGRKFARGWLGFRLGRQYMIDSLGWWSFDGGSVKVTTPAFFALEAYGGFEVRGGLPLSSPRFERDGIQRGNRDDWDRTLFPTFQPTGIAPAVGAALESAGLTFLHGRLDYRRVHNTGGSNVTAFGSGLTRPVTYDGTRLSSERIGYTINGSLPQVGGFKGGFAYDMYLSTMANIYASVDGYVTRKVTLGVDYDFYRPTFDADSIFNFFTVYPSHDLGLRGQWDATSRLSLSGTVHGRALQNETEPDQNNSSTGIGSPTQVDPSYPSSGAVLYPGARLAARYRRDTLLAGIRSQGDFGDGGRRLGADVYAEDLFRNHWIATGRIGAWSWNDELRPDRDATSLGIVAGAGYRFDDRSRIVVEYEHNVNRLVGQRSRVIAWFTVATTR